MTTDRFLRSIFRSDSIALDPFPAVKLPLIVLVMFASQRYSEAICIKISNFGV
jgi:hypothetical protein